MQCATRGIFLGIILCLPLPALTQESNETGQSESTSASDSVPSQRRISNEEALARKSRAAGLGGPQSVGAELEESRIRGELPSRSPGLDEVLDPIVDFKQSLIDRYRLDLGMRYSTTYQKASETLTGEDDGWAGQIRFYGKWHLQGEGRNKGNLVFLLEDRHSYGGDVTPTSLSNEIGSLAPTATSYGDNGTALTVVYWDKVFQDGRSGIWLGKIDPTELTDVLGYANQRTTFANGAVLSNLSVASPLPALGVSAGTMITDNYYTIGVLSDANGSYRDLPVFRYGADFYKYLEFGYIPSRTWADRYTRNIHFGAWHMDETEEVGRDESYGVLVGTNWLIGDNLLPFFRYGIADGDGAIVDSALSLGLLYKPDWYNDLFGIGLGWVEPGDAALNEETSVEVFYRYSFSRDIAVTVSAQTIFDPAFNSEHDQVNILGTRIRMAF
jgi:porin